MLISYFLNITLSIMLALLLIQLMLTTSDCSLPEEFKEQRVIYLDVNETYFQESLTLIQSIYSRNLVHIYCRNEQRLELGNIFQTNYLQLITEKSNMKYTQYKGMTPHSVYRSYLKSEECYEGKLMSGRTKQVHYISLPAYSQACYGIYTDQAYNLTLLQKETDEVRVGRFIIGLILWLTVSQVGEFLALCYMVAIIFGVYLGSFSIVCLALFFAGDHQLKSLQPIGANFKLLLEQSPTTVTLGLVAGVWLLIKFYQQYRLLRRFQLIRFVHFRLMRLISYLLIFYSSENLYFGWFFISLLLPWPELYWLIHWLRNLGIKIKRMCLPPKQRRLLNEEEFLAQSGFETQRALTNLSQRLYSQAPKWEQVAQLQAPQDFARFVCSGTVVKDTPPTVSSSENLTSSLLEQLTAAINNPSATCESVESLYRNLRFSDSTRSLRTDPRQN